MKLPVLAQYLRSVKRLPGPPKSFFPNIVFTLIRAERRLPNQVIFKCPKFMNKFTITNYLESIYQIKVKNVQTINYRTRYKEDPNYPQNKITIPAFKKAYVTLYHDFEYPPTLDLKSLTEDQLKEIKFPKREMPEFTTKSVRKMASEISIKEDEKLSLLDKQIKLENLKIFDEIPKYQ